MNQTLEQEAANDKGLVPTVRVERMTAVNKPGNKCRALVDLIIAERYRLRGVQVMDGVNGIFISMPSRKVGEKYVDVFDALSKEERESIKTMVMAAYNFGKGGVGGGQ